MGMGGSMKALNLLKFLSLSSTMAIAFSGSVLLTPKAQGLTGYENPQQFANFLQADQSLLQAQAQTQAQAEAQALERDRQRISEQVILLHRQMVGPNASLSSRHLAAYVNCIEQNVCTWDDVRAHIAHTNPVDNRYQGRSEDEYSRRPIGSSSRDNRSISQRHGDRYRDDEYRDYEYNDGQVLQAQSRERQQIEEQVRRLYRQMLGNNARISRRDLRDYVNCIERDRCDWDDVREEIAYSDAGEEAIEEIYQEVLERDPDRGGMRTYQDRLADDWNIQDIREDIAESDEAEQAINRIYREILGRNADSRGLRTYQRKLSEDWSLDKVRRDIANSDEARRRRGG
ncbi:hypothetical protein AM228_19570 [Planktothricoides sp. SR001]|nr:hypothetical protein AM228_19570 [Planktothricoides sp. SR001]